MPERRATTFVVGTNSSRSLPSFISTMMRAMSFFGLDVIHAADAYHRFRGAAAVAVVVADDARDIGGFELPFEAFFLGVGLEKIFRDLPWLESGPCGFGGVF